MPPNYIQQSWFVDSIYPSPKSKMTQVFHTPPQKKLLCISTASSLIQFGWLENDCQTVGRECPLPKRFKAPFFKYDATWIYILFCLLIQPAYCRADGFQPTIFICPG
jgi:hypothetical protein